MIYYSTGFLFTPDQQRVALIRKARPTWQAGRLNGVGGHIERDEDAPAAMCREFQEETGSAITEWEPFCTLIHEHSPVDWTVYFFKCFQPAPNKFICSIDEVVEWYEVWDICLRPDIVPNLKWLIPMALEDLNGKVMQFNWPHDH